MTTPAFVQAAQSSATTLTTIANGGTISATLGASPTVGNLLVAVVSMQGASGYTMPGWTKQIESTVLYNNGQGAGGVAKAMFSRVVQSGDSTTVGTATNSQGSSANMHITVGEYSGLGTGPLFGGGTFVDDTSGSSTSKAMNALTPTAGVPVLMLVVLTLNPNYNPAMPTGWTQRTHLSMSGGARYTCDLGDQIQASPSGSYGGTFTGAGSETAWHIGTVYVTNAAGGANKRSMGAIIG